MFVDRLDAGEKLAQALSHYKGKDTVVLAIPRGGVIVGAKVAKKLSASLDLIIPRKIGAPGNPELGIGAVAGDEEPIINEGLIRSLNVSPDYIEHETKREREEIKRRRIKYLGKKSPFSLEGRIAILVDDGLATGYTALAAISAIKKRKPSKLVLAVPVAPRETVENIKGKVDELICLNAPELFFAVGQFYSDFSQVTDDEVIEVLRGFEE